MLNHTHAFFSFSVNDVSAAMRFYGETLGLKVEEVKLDGRGKMMNIFFEGGCRVMVYEKEDHVPATFTVLNLPVSKIDREVSELAYKGIVFERYQGTDEKGITRNSGPLIAWFKDPAGNFISVMEEERASVKDELRISKFIPASRHEVFKWWVTPELVEKWSSPEGMLLQVPKLEARVGGKYIFDHSSEKGHYICNGEFKEFIQDIKLVQVDSVKGPDNKMLFEDLESKVIFNDIQGGTEISLTQIGFPDLQSLRECALSWNQCLDQLTEQLTGKRKSCYQELSRGDDHLRC